MIVMQQPLPSTEPRLEGSEAICRDLQITADRAISLVADALIMARQLQLAIDLRWRLIVEAKRMSSGMQELVVFRSRRYNWPGSTPGNTQRR